jgi:2-polyprenyl-3-methyl-5-hydroxy-6-metoxy-1,4-benzoquinol methylase
VAGTEISPYAARRAGERLAAPVHCGELAELALEPGGFDLVTFWHVLEHLLSPAGALARARELLRPGGLLAVAVPNRRNTLFRAAYRVVRGRRLLLYRPDDREQHLHHWDPPALRAAMEAAGFDAPEIRPDRCALGAGRRMLEGLGALHGALRGEARSGALLALARRGREVP